ncbi:type VI secretion system Hcp family effector [Mangrovibacter plantisponsor]|uniref:Type VI secretion system Hcp family effector n=1 Tax=Mangrovibacter plantisponsor TaxID=451513 RepID=A0A317PZG6_9ENTR|nr:type VI secretion system Hcp family effector [Mangrovibacter plantisponsor]
MAVPVHLILTDDGGALTRGSSDAIGREGSIELRGLQHNLAIPTDPMTGKVTGTRQHSPFQFSKELDSSSPYLFKATATGQNLKSAEICMSCFTGGYGSGSASFAVCTLHFPTNITYCLNSEFTRQKTFACPITQIVR